MSNVMETYNAICEREKVDPRFVYPCVSYVFERDGVECGLCPQVDFISLQDSFYAFAKAIRPDDDFTFVRCEIVGFFDTIKREFVNLKSFSQLFDKDDVDIMREEILVSGGEYAELDNRSDVL